MNLGFFARLSLFSFISACLFSQSFVIAATTVGLNITTGGTLSVTGHSTFSTTQMTGLRLSTGAVVGNILQSDALGNASWVSGQSVLSSLALDDLGDVDTTGQSAGSLLYFDGTNWVDLADGGVGEVLTSDGLGGLFWTAAGGMGTVTSIASGNGLQGGPITATGTLSLGPLISDWDQTGAFDVVLNNADSELKILESAGGSFYTTIDAGDLTSDRVVTFGDNSGEVTTAGNDFNGVDQLVQLDGTGALPAVDGGNLTGVVAEGIVDDAVGESSLNVVNGATDEYCLTYELATLNFEWQTCSVGDVNTASNVGAGDGVFKQKTGTDLEFKSLTEGTGVTITANADDVSIAVDEAALDLGNIGGDVDLTSQVTGALPVLNGGTGATDALTARTNLGLGSLSTLSTVTTTEITDGTVAEADLNISNGATDEYCLTYELATLNFEWQTCSVGDVNTASNVGAGDGVFKQKTGTDLEFKSLTEGTGVTITANADDVNIAVDEAALDLGNIGGDVDLTSQVTGALPVLNGGTGATDAPTARTNLGLGSLSTLSTVTTTEITDGTVAEADLNISNGATDEYCLTYELATLNFEWQTCSVGDVNTASNVGAGDGVFKQKTGTDLEFKSLTEGTGVTITANADDVNIAVDEAALDLGNIGGDVDLTSQVTGALPVLNGGTGATDAPTARTNLGLGSLSTLSTVTNAEIANGTILFQDIGQNGCALDEIIKWDGLAWACDTDGGAVSLDGAYNNGSSITVDAGAVSLTVPNGANNSGLLINQNDATNDLDGLVITAVAGVDSDAIDVSDVDILNAINIGSNNIVTGATTITSTELDVLDGGITESEVVGEIESVTAGDGLSGGGTADDITLDIDIASVAADGALTSSISGMEIDGNGQLSLIRGCADGEVLSWDNTGFAWECSSTGGISLQSAYDGGATITTAGSTNVAFNLASGNFTASGVGAVNLTPTSASSFTSGGALTLTGGAASTWSTSSGALNVDSAAGLNLGTTNATSVNIGNVANTGSLTIQTNGTGDSEVVLPNGSVSGTEIADSTLLEVDLNAVNSPTDEYCLTYESTVGDFEWQTCSVGEVNTASNVGAGDGIFKQKTGLDLEFKSLTEGAGIAVTSNADDLNIAVDEASLDLGNIGGDVDLTSQVTGALPVLNGGTGAADAPTARTNLGLGSLSTLSAVGSAQITDSSIAEADLNVVNTATDENCLTYESTVGDFEWQSCGATSLQTAYNGGASITTAGSTNIAFTLTSGNFNASGAGAVNLTPTSASSFTSGGALTLTGGAASTWSTSSGALTLNSAANLNLGTSASTGVTIGNVANTGAVTVQTNGTGDSEVVLPSGAVSGTEITDSTVAEVDIDIANAATDEFCLTYESGSSNFEWQTCSSGGNTLDQSYDQGGAGAGRSITADTGTVEVTVPIGSNNAALTLNQNNTTNNPAAFVITNAGTGNDITGSNFAFAKAGTLTITPTVANGMTLAPFGVAAGNTTEMRFRELVANGSNYVGFKAPDLIGTDRIYTLPSADGTSGQVLQTNGSGATSWVTTSTGGATSANYFYAYDTTEQSIASANTWQNVTFANRPQISGWTYSAGDFTAPQTGLYSVSYTAYILRTGGAGGTTGNTRLRVNGSTTVAGSEVGFTWSAANIMLPVTQSAIVSLTAGDELALQIVGSSTNVRTDFTTGNASAPITAALTVTRIQ